MAGISFLDRITGLIADSVYRRVHLLFAGRNRRPIVIARPAKQAVAIYYADWAMRLLRFARNDKKWIYLQTTGAPV